MLVSRISIQFQPFETNSGRPNSVSCDQAHLGDIKEQGTNFIQKYIELGFGVHYAFTDCSCDKECNCLVLYLYLLKSKIGRSVEVLCSVLAVELKVPVEGVSVSGHCPVVIISEV